MHYWFGPSNTAWRACAQEKTVYETMQAFLKQTSWITSPQNWQVALGLLESWVWVKSQHFQQRLILKLERSWLCPPTQQYLGESDKSGHVAGPVDSQKKSKHWNFENHQVCCRCCPWCSTPRASRTHRLSYCCFKNYFLMHWLTIFCDSRLWVICPPLDKI